MNRKFYWKYNHLFKKNYINYKKSQFSNFSNNLPSWNVLFFGTDSVSIKTLYLLKMNQINPSKTNFPKIINHIEVVCPKEVIPNTVPIKNFCIKYNIPFHHPLPTLKKWKIPQSSIGESFNIIVVVSFGHLIPSHIIDSMMAGGINMHPSLLPKYRGPAPIYHTLLNNENETGISIIELSKNKFDVGKILKQIKYPIEPYITFNQLTEKLSELGAQYVLETLYSFWELKKNAIPQSEEGVSHAPKITKEMGNIKWYQHSNEDIWRLWRALGDTIGIHTLYNFNKQRIRLVTLKPPEFKISYANPEKFENLYSPGMLKYDIKQEILFIKCIKNWIGCSELQLDGRKIINACSFVNGYKIRNLCIPNEQHKFIDFPIFSS